MMNTLLTLPVLLSLLTATVIPGVSSLLSRTHWPVEVTALLTVILSAVSGFCSELAVDPHEYSTLQAGLIALGVYVVAAVARSQFWRNTTTDAKFLAVGSKG